MNFLVYCMESIWPELMYALRCEFCRPVSLHLGHPNFKNIELTKF